MYANLICMFSIWQCNINKTYRLSKPNKWNSRNKHKKKSCPFPPPQIATIVWFDYIAITFGHFMFASGFLHKLLINIIHSCYVHYVVHLWIYNLDLI
jgi:hypothetical protein